MRKPCTVEGCDEYRVGGGLCRKHYMRLRRKGSTSDERKNARVREECSVDGCERPYIARGLCENHYRASRLPPKVRISEGRDVYFPPDPRVCDRCGITYQPIRRGGRFCSRKCKEEAHIANGGAAAAQLRHYYRNKYGFSMEEVEELRKDAICAICGTTEFFGRHLNAHLDHDHVTGQFRGTLCHNCNVGLGYFKDDPAILTKAIQYLQLARIP